MFNTKNDKYIIIATHGFYITMKINDINESTTSGSVAAVSAPIGGMKTRGQSAYSNQKSGNLLKGKKTKSKFANSLSEDELAEQDLIIVPGQGNKIKPGFIPHDKDRTDHEVEMARSDLFQCAKNAKTIYELIIDLTEDDGLPGWVQSKITLASDYLNSVQEYLEHKTYMHEELSPGALVWQQAMKFPFVVRGTKNNVKNELIGSYKTKEEAEQAAKKYPDAKVYNNISGKVIESTEKKDWGSMSKSEFKRREMEHELGHEDSPEFEAKLRNYERGPWYISIDGKILKQKGEPKVFDWRKGANNYALAILRNKPELEGKITLTKKLPDTSISESKEKSPDYGNWYIRINGKVLSDSTFKAIPFDSKESAKSRAFELARKKNIPLENIKLTKSWMDAPEQMSEAKKSKALAEKATSKKQQKFMGMVYAAKKGEKPASKEVAKVAKDISKKDAKDFAQTKHKGLPEKSKKDNK